MLSYFDLLDKPYREGERGPDAYDCYGIVMEMYRRKGVCIADYPTQDTPEGNALQMLRAAAQHWIRLPAVIPECAVTLRLRDHTHIGFVLNRTEFIHTIKGRGVGVDELQNIQWRRNITGFYQWRGAE